MNPLRTATLFLLGFMLACGTRDPASAPPAAAKPTLLIGLIPERNIFKQVERYEPLAQYLSAKAGIDIKLKVLTHYGNVLENFESLKLDGAFFGSFGYALAHARLGVQALARPESLDGTSSYRGDIIVRKDGGIATVKDMKGKRLALVAPATFAGYLFPLVHLHGAGVDDPVKHFKEVYYAGSHEAALHDVLQRKADVGAVKNTVFRELASADARVERELEVLAESVDVPENGLALRSTISPAVKEKLLQALISMHEDPEGAKALKALGARRFIRTTDTDYEPFARYGRVLGLDLATYRVAAEQ